MSIVQINFQVGDDYGTAKEVRSVFIRNIVEGLKTAQGNAGELREWLALFKEGKFMTEKLLDQALYGPAPDQTRKQTITPEAI